MKALLAKLSALIDSVPQLPGGAYVNHFAWGGALGVLIAFALHQMPYMVWLTCWAVATAAVGGITAAKKFSDYQPPKSESLSMCVGKTIVTAALPAILYLYWMGK